MKNLGAGINFFFFLKIKEEKQPVSSSPFYQNLVTLLAMKS